MDVRRIHLNIPFGVIVGHILFKLTMQLLVAVWILDRAIPIGTLSTNWYSRNGVAAAMEVVGAPASSGDPWREW